MIVTVVGAIVAAAGFALTRVTSRSAGRASGMETVPTAAVNEFSGIDDGVKLRLRTFGSFTVPVRLMLLSTAPVLVRVMSPATGPRTEGVATRAYPVPPADGRLAELLKLTLSLETSNPAGAPRLIAAVRFAPTTEKLWETDGVPKKAVKAGRVAPTVIKGVPAGGAAVTVKLSTRLVPVAATGLVPLMATVSTTANRK